VDMIDQVMLQVTQPYFYYAVGAMLASFLAVNVVLRLSGLCSHRARSYLHLMPLLAPMFVLILYPPRLYIYTMGLPNSVPPSLSFGTPAFTGFMQMAPPGLVQILSVTGLLCIAGLVLGIAVLALCLNPGQRWLSKCGVIFAMDDDFPQVQVMVRECADKFGIAPPRLGILEDLRPNAFIAGRGNKAVIILSLGLIGSFSDDEVRAAIAHEMMHLRHGDQLFRSVTIALAAASFYNPLAYFSATAALREREHWADTGSIVAGYPISALEDALRKVSSSPCPTGAGALRGLNLWLLTSSPLLPKRWLSFHPSVEQRIDAIKRPQESGRTSMLYLGLALVTITMLSLVVLVSFQEVRLLALPEHNPLPLAEIHMHVHNAPIAMGMGHIAPPMDMHVPPGPPSPPLF